jgi:hypothetical protein
VQWRTYMQSLKDCLQPHVHSWVCQVLTYTQSTNSTAPTAIAHHSPLHSMPRSPKTKNKYGEVVPDTIGGRQSPARACIFNTLFKPNQFMTDMLNAQRK